MIIETRPATISISTDGVHAVLITPRIHCGSFVIKGCRIKDLDVSRLRPHLGLVTIDVATDTRYDRGWDLALVLGSLSLVGKAGRLSGRAFWGTVDREGRVKPAGRAYVASTCAAMSMGVAELLVAPEDALEAALVGDGLRVIPVSTIEQAIGHLTNLAPITPFAPLGTTPPQTSPDLLDIRGLPRTRRAVEIAAAGRHGLLLQGEPGVGKTMIARRAVGLLPDLASDEAVAVALVQSAAGILRDMPKRPPFRAPHHTVSVAGIAGRDSQPGELQLADRGLLFLDDLPEFTRACLDRIRAHNGSAWIIGAMNPCPCGYAGRTDRPCACSTTSIDRYWYRVAPVLPRFSMRVDLDADLDDGKAPESSATVRARVAQAVALREARILQFHTSTSTWRLLKQTTQLARRLFHHTDRDASFGQTIRVAQTIADLDNRSDDPFRPITEDQITEALHFTKGAAVTLVSNHQRRKLTKEPQE